MKQLTHNSMSLKGKSVSMLGDLAQAFFTRNRMRVFGTFRLLGSALALTVLFAFNPALTNEHSEADFASASSPAKNEWTCQLSAPSYCDGERTGTATAHLDWASVQSAVSYSLTVYDQSTSELLQNFVISGTSTDLSGLQSGKTYRCVVAAMCSGGSTSSFIIVEDILD